MRGARSRIGGFDDAQYASAFGGERHVFADVKAVLAAASPRRSGDELAGLAAERAAPSRDNAHLMRLIETTHG